MSNCIRPAKCNVQIINDRKYPVKGFGFVIVKIPKTNIIIPLWTSYYMPQNPQNTILRTALKHNNGFISVKTEALRWLKTTTDTGKKLKYETTVKERDQKLLDFITINVLKIIKQDFLFQGIITLLMTPIINSTFNKHPMS